MKAFITIIMLLSAICSYAEVIPLSLSAGVYQACVRDTVSVNVDTIRIVALPGVQLSDFSISVMLESVAGATDSFFCNGNPYFGNITDFAVWDSSKINRIVGEDTTYGAFAVTRAAVNWDTVATGSAPIQINFRNAGGASDYPLDWVDDARHYPFVLSTETVEGWNPPFSTIWDFYVHVGTGADRAVLTFCVCYAPAR